MLTKSSAGRPSLVIAATLLLEVLTVYGVEAYLLEGKKQRAYAHVSKKVAQEVDARFRQGVLMLHAKQHEHALTAFHRVLELRPSMPEAHVNLGFAFLGLGKNKEALDFFQSALAIRQTQVNAHYGAALALFGLGNRTDAIHSMYQYLALSSDLDPYRAQAEALLHDWRQENQRKPDSTKPHSRNLRDSTRHP